MTRMLSLAAASLFAVTLLAGCGNTIRGVGADAANTVDATQNAVGNTANAARD